jgi:predicted CopG family antitoxin
MTKTISLSDDAYEALVAVRGPGESFSDVARRAAKELARRRLFDEARRPLWTKAEAEALLAGIYADRDASKAHR